jgi:DUF177 domain-containing protein
MRTVSRTVAAPADLAGELVRVPVDSDLLLDLRLESVSEGVLVSGTVQASLTGECARCLEPLTDDFEVELQQLYVYPGRESAADDDDEVGRVVDDYIDLEPLVRDAVVLALPLAPVCRDDCPGLCPQCGMRLADAEPGHRHNEVDPRWAALQALQTAHSSQSDGQEVRDDRDAS